MTKGEVTGAIVPAQGWAELVAWQADDGALTWSLWPIVAFWVEVEGFSDGKEFASSRGITVDVDGMGDWSGEDGGDTACFVIRLDVISLDEAKMLHEPEARRRLAEKRRLREMKQIAGEK